MKVGAVLFLGVFGLFWSSITLFFDVMIARDISGGLRSRSFQETTGHVLQSSVSNHRGSKGGVTYSADLLYDYEVNGESFRGKKLRFGAISGSDRGWAESMVQMHPAGSRTAVYFNPANPSEAVIVPGLNSTCLFTTIFITPFNAVMLGLWAAGISTLLSKKSGGAGGVPLIQEAMRTRVRLPRFSALFAALVSLAGTAFAAIFIVGFSTKMNPSMNTVIGTWGAILCVSGVLFSRRWLRIQSGAEDLVLDEGSRALTLPQTFGRKQATSMPYESVRAVEVKSILHRGSKGGVSYTYAPVLFFKNSTEEEKLADWPNREKAEAFAAWLSERIGLAAKP